MLNRPGLILKPFCIFCCTMAVLHTLNASSSVIVFAEWTLSAAMYGGLTDTYTPQDVLM